MSQNPCALAAGKLSLCSLQDCTWTYDGSTHHMGPIPHRILTVLVANADRTVRWEALIRAVWNAPKSSEFHNLASAHISAIHARLGLEAGELIETLPAYGLIVRGDRAEGSGIITVTPLPPMPPALTSAERVRSTWEVQAGPISLLDWAERTWICDGSELSASPTEHLILFLVVGYAGELVKTEMIRNVIWPHATTGDVREILRTTVPRLCKKMGPAGSHIETVRGVGYKVVV